MKLGRTSYLRAFGALSAALLSTQPALAAVGPISVPLSTRGASSTHATSLSGPTPPRPLRASILRAGARISAACPSTYQLP